MQLKEKDKVQQLCETTTEQSKQILKTKYFLVLYLEDFSGMLGFLQKHIVNEFCSNSRA